MINIQIWPRWLKSITCCVVIQFSCLEMHINRLDFRNTYSVIFKIFTFDFQSVHFPFTHTLTHTLSIHLLRSGGFSALSDNLHGPIGNSTFRIFSSLSFSPCPYKAQHSTQETGTNLMPLSPKQVWLLLWLVCICARAKIRTINCEPVGWVIKREPLFTLSNKLNSI